MRGTNLCGQRVIMIVDKNQEAVVRKFPVRSYKSFGLHLFINKVSDESGFVRSGAMQQVRLE